MIQNVLQFHELASLIQPFLRLADIQTIVSTLNDILGITISDCDDDIIYQTKLLSTYKEYRIDIRDLRLLKNFGITVCIQFKAKKKWTHGLFKDQNKEIVNDIQKVCKLDIVDLSFTRYTATVPGDLLLGENSPLEFVYFHDARAFNKDWKNDYEVGYISPKNISPLLISPDSHHGNCFIEFQFNPACYTREHNQTVLRPDWLNNVFLI